MTITKKIVGFTAGILFSITAFAQTIAVVDVQRVVSKLPQMATLQQTLQTEFSGRTEEIKKLESDIKFNMEKFQRESMTMSQEQQDALRKQIEEQQTQFQMKAQPLQEDIRRRQGEERNKILALVKTAIDAVAAEEKIDLVLQANAVAFVVPEKDISDKVAEKVSKLN